MIDKSQIEIMKEQVIEHIRANFPEGKKQEAIQQILLMNDEEFLALLKENNMIAEDENENLDSNKNKCIFCSIVFEDVPSIKIDENEKAIAILEINPISEGHILIVPKSHISSTEKLDKKIEELVLIVKEKIENSLKPKEVKIIVSEIFGHSIINLVPIYTNETFDSKRKHTTNEELLNLKKKIESSNHEKIMKKSDDSLKKVDEGTENKTNIQEETSKKEVYSGKIPKRIP
jgi:histidine triad (HIT) family protein